MHDPPPHEFNREYSGGRGRGGRGGGDENNDGYAERNMAFQRAQAGHAGGYGGGYTGFGAASERAAVERQAKLNHVRGRANRSEEKARMVQAKMAAKREEADARHSRLMQASERRASGGIPHLSDITTGEWALAGLGAGLGAYLYFA